jgi:ribosome-binding protein aMBF1 (putative translation factor)
MAAGEQMGTGTCTFCGYEHVKLKESKNGGAAGTCTECGAQAFGKSPKAANAAKERQAARKPPAGDKEEGAPRPTERTFAAEVFGEDA